MSSVLYRPIRTRILHLQNDAHASPPLRYPHHRCSTTPRRPWLPPWTSAAYSLDPGALPRHRIIPAFARHRILSAVGCQAGCLPLPPTAGSLLLKLVALGCPSLPPSRRLDLLLPYRWLLDSPSGVEWTVLVSKTFSVKYQCFTDICFRFCK